MQLIARAEPIGLIGLNARPVGFWVGHKKTPGTSKELLCHTARCQSLGRAIPKSCNY